MVIHNKDFFFLTEKFSIQKYEFMVEIRLHSSSCNSLESDFPILLLNPVLTKSKIKKIQIKGYEWKAQNSILERVEFGVYRL